MKSHGNSIIASHEFPEMNDKSDQSISRGPMIRITPEGISYHATLAATGGQPRSAQTAAMALPTCQSRLGGVGAVGAERDTANLSNGSWLSDSTGLVSVCPYPLHAREYLMHHYLFVQVVLPSTWGGKLFHK